MDAQRIETESVWNDVTMSLDIMWLDLKVCDDDSWYDVTTRLEMIWRQDICHEKS